LLYRASTKKQTDSENDIPLQRNILKPWAEKQGYEFKTVFVEGGVSGFKVHAADRDALNEIKAMADRREFDILGIYMSDRLGRIADETPLIIGYLNARGIKVISYTEGEICSSDHNSKLMTYLKYWMAEGESRKTSARCSDAMAEAVKQGRWRGGAPPFGYRRVLKGSVNFKGRPIYDIEIDPEQAEIVRLVFDLYLNQKYGARKIASYLNEKGYHSPKGTLWKNIKILAILHSRLYTGVYLLHAHRNNPKPIVESPFMPHLKIIEQETFDGVQKLLKQNYNNKVPNGRRVNRPVAHGRMLLTGLVYCGECGRKLYGHYAYPTGQQKKTVSERTVNWHYLCRTADLRELQSPCSPAMWSCNKIDPLVIADAKQFIRTIDKEKLMDDYNNAAEIELKDLNSRDKKLEAELNKKSFDIKKLKDELVRSIIGESAVSKEMLSDLIQTREAEYLALFEERKAVTDKINSTEAMLKEKKRIAEQLTDWDAIFESQPPEGKKAMLIGLIDKITLYGDSVEVAYKIDISATVNEIIDNDGVSLQTAGQSPINTNDIAVIKSPLTDMTRTHIVERRLEFIKGARGQKDAIALRLGMPIENAVVEFCSEPRSRKEIADYLGYTTHYLCKGVVYPLIESGRLFYTLPKTPTSPSQRFTNANIDRYGRDVESVLGLCKKPTGLSLIAKLLTIDIWAARENFVKPLLEIGKLECRIIGKRELQKYVTVTE
jgi:DNA invertase Pin-like site-specific DNA recombinase